MNIYFDLEKENLLNSLSSETKYKLKKIKNLVIQRLKVLEDEINSQNGEILMKIHSSPPGIMYKGFTNELIEKMKICVTDDDFEDLFFRLGI